MNQNFAAFIRNRLGSEKQKEFAARMGISAAQLCKVLHGNSCERETVTKIIAGISDEPMVQARCLAAFLSDFLCLGGTAANRIRIDVVGACEA